MPPRDLAAPRKLVRLALQVNDVQSARIEHRSAVERFANQGDYESPRGDRAVMSDEQAAYIGVPVAGPYKAEHYRY